jgi:hypothetical protein
VFLKRGFIFREKRKKRTDCSKTRQSGIGKCRTGFESESWVVF